MIQQNKNKIKEEWTLPVLTPYTGILDDLGGVTTRFKLQASPTHSSHHLHPPPITHILLPSPTSSSHHPHPPPITHTLLPSPTPSSHHPHPPPITHTLLPSPTPSSHHPHPPPITHTLLPSPTPSSHHPHPPPITHTLLPSPTPSSHHPHPPPITHTLLFLLSCTVLVFYYHSVTSSCTFHYKISSPLHSLHSLHSSLIHQVFFAVVVGAMYLGQSSPNLQSLATAASANGPLCETIDRVSAQP